jgi:hypothetical protein
MESVDPTSRRAIPEGTFLFFSHTDCGRLQPLGSRLVHLGNYIHNPYRCISGSLFAGKLEKLDQFLEKRLENV